MSDCPGPDALQYLLTRAQDDEQRRQLRAHAETCSVCREGLRQSPATVIDPLRPSSTSLPPLSTSLPLPEDTESESVAPLPVLPDYEILRVLGRGGMGVVYLARDPALKRLVAVKMLLGGDQASEQEQARLRAEAEAVARIHHPHVVQIYTTGRHNGCPYLVCEYVEGGSLAARLGRRPQPPRDAARLVELVARGVQAAHQRGIVHRDLKPGNVLLAPPAEEPALNSAYGVPKVADFGLARSTEESRQQAASGLVGTADYMAPEQAQGLPAGRAADVYALGVILYECLTGRPPFVGTSVWELLVQVREAEPVLPSRLAAGLPRDLETICLKCLEKDPQQRYASAADLAEDLRRFLNHFPILARRSGPVGRTIKWVRRRPTLAASLALASVALLVASFFGYQAHRAEQQRQMEQALLTGDLRKEQRERALEKAFEAAMGGDLKKAEKAIGDAETYGASAGQVCMLRGQVAFSRGDWEPAMADLEQAVKLEPESVAARGMLAMAYLGFGDFHRYLETGIELDRLTPHSSEDYLFRGYSKAWSRHSTDPFGLHDLEKAVTQSRWPLARAIRADNRMLYAESRTDLEEIEKAVRDIQLAKEYLPDNPYVLSVSVRTHVVAANLYLEAGKPDRQKTAQEEAERDAAVLKRWDTLAFPFYGLKVYFEQTGQEPALFDLARRTAENSHAPVFADEYAKALYRRGQSREALAVLEGRKWKTFLGDYFRVCILAELHPQDRGVARAAYEDMAKRYTRGDYVAYLEEILCLLGYEDEAIAIWRKVIQQYPTASTLKAKLDYWTESISASEYLGRARGKWARLGTHYQIALQRLTRGDRLGAREHLRRAVETRVILNYDHDFTRAFLARMEQDPTWPPWIPLSKSDPKPAASSPP